MWVNYGQRVLIKTENDTFGSKLSNDMTPQRSVKWWSCLPIESQGLLCQLQGGLMVLCVQQHSSSHHLRQHGQVLLLDWTVLRTPVVSLPNWLKIGRACRSPPMGTPA